MGLNQQSSNGNFSDSGELLTNDTEFYLNMSSDYALAQTNTTLINGVASREIEIHNIFISSSTATGSVTLTEETSGTIIFKTYLQANSGAFSGVIHKDLVAGKGLLITCPNNTFISVTYHLD